MRTRGPDPVSTGTTRAERNALFDAIRLLDQGAATASTDLRQRRFGLRPETDDRAALAARPEDTSRGGQRAEDAADPLAPVPRRRSRSPTSLLAWKRRQTDDDRILRDLGDTYSRLEAYPSRSTSSGCGSEQSRRLVTWFNARYSLALDYYHSGQFKQAAQLIDATAILHPDLGGGELHEKFIRL